MPLSDHIPVIDDRRFDDIISELRTRIARYTPEWQPVWTDVNESDPGITLAQVFAWLSEMLIYRMGKIPEANYLKFLQLLGIELKPAEPAHADIAFPVKKGNADPFVIVAEGTQVAAETDDGARLIFETDRAITALGAKLVAVQSFDGYAYTDVTNENEGADEGFLPFGPPAATESALLLGFDYAGAFPTSVEMSLAVWIDEASIGSSAYRCDLPGTPSFPSATLAWEYFNGTQWATMNLLKDETSAFTRSGYVFLKTPASESMAKAVIGLVDKKYYWIRARLQTTQYEDAPVLQAVRANTVAATQAETIRDEVLGGSDGSPNQVLSVDNTPIIEGSFTLEVDEGDGYRQWTMVDDFYGSSSKDRHYVLNRTSGEVRFGDGLHGAIPAANVKNPAANILARKYRIGGGTEGNVAADTITTLLTPTDGLDADGITNIRAAHSGRDEESLDEAKLRAPLAIKSKCRAVTPEDFEYHAMQASNIKRARALPLYHPDFPEVKIPGVVTVIVVPDSTLAAPVPSEGTLRTVCAYLNQRRLLTTELYVQGPGYTEISVTVDAVAQSHADSAEVKNRLEEALLSYFHPLTGGESGNGWPFGGAVRFSLVYRHVLDVPGLRRINRLTIEADGEEYPECTDVPVGRGHLVFSTGHTVTIGYDVDGN